MCIVRLLPQVWHQHLLDLVSLSGSNSLVYVQAEQS